MTVIPLLSEMCFNYDGTLAEMRKLLESDHGELWNTPEFCIAYLKVLLSNAINFYRDTVS